ncbi:MAG: uncharacterized protein KVP18_004628 [Porospora cf. gigantea A]|uniref:uncharacterized protein n=1 Tax=Porospora cf. gigantea A TaxID=2853593 RepID=UPI0035593A4C|nr:MAG: hypothetical protein KVP18_004628 [Porospora cf. gigantea A]
MHTKRRSRRPILAPADSQSHRTRSRVPVPAPVAQTRVRVERKPSDALKRARAADITQRETTTSSHELELPEVAHDCVQMERRAEWELWRHNERLRPMSRDRRREIESRMSWYVPPEPQPPRKPRVYPLFQNGHFTMETEHKRKRKRSSWEQLADESDAAATTHDTLSYHIFKLIEWTSGMMCNVFSTC